MTDTILSPKDRILMQLATQQAVFKYDYGGDWADSLMVGILADFLVKNGVKSISDIAQFNQVMPFSDNGEIVYTNLNYFYDRTTGKTIQGTAQDVTASADKPQELFYWQLWSNGGDTWNLNIVVKFDEFGRPFFVFIPIMVPRSEDGWHLFRDLHSLSPTDNWHAIKEILASWGYGALIVMVVVSVFVPGLGAAIGGAVLGPAMAAAYPMLAQAIGSIVINTVMNGGDIEQGIKTGLVGTVAGPYGAAALNAVEDDSSESWQYLIVSVAVGGVTQTFGQSVAIEFDSKLAGAVAQSATQALLVGDSVEDAVTKSLIKNTGSVVNTVAQVVPASGTEDKAMFGSDDYEYIDDSSVIPEDMWDFELPDFDFDFSGIDFSGFLDDVDGVMPDVDFSVPDGSGTLDLTSSDLSSSFDMSNVWNGLTALAQLALKNLPAIKSLTSKASQNPTTRVNANGTVTTTNSNGQILTTKPAIGQPVTDANGITYVNNGNGTYTVVRPDGSTQTLPYPGTQTASSGKISTQNLMIGVAVIGGGLLLLSQRGRRR